MKQQSKTLYESSAKCMPRAQDAIHFDYFSCDSFVSIFSLSSVQSKQCTNG